ncbi:hypothetical protein [Litorilituus lipolyticus]|uniref:Uncharacterized protein n=1 Tax=Litorilituus lipolyticus TaxID=2491017 RepID=A0A502KLP9_9GAMM|nr:hypothetical protein [Litorilituus lipolyticus]TPH12538.1 hypothetical protein EPA86_16485 [Litorilituus lipolyticus]
MRKINTLIALSIGILVSNTSFAAVPSSETVKLEPVKQENLVAHAQASLAASFSTIELEKELPQLSTDNVLVNKKKSENKNKTMTISKITLVAE